MLEQLKQTPHTRRNPLTGEWILVSPHRLERPWQGKVEDTPSDTRPEYDPKCYLCPRNTRAGGHVNPDYQSTFVFTNDYAALLEDSEPLHLEEKGLLEARSESGTCRVICFSPRHDLTLPRLARPEIREVVDLWAGQYAELGARDSIGYVQIFENKGALMGCSNPHPHGQIWATGNLPVEPAKEHESQLRYHADHGHRCLLCEYGALELARGERMVCSNAHWLAVVPFWAKWPYETMILPVRHARHLGDLSGDERDGLADLMRRLTVRYDNLFHVSFPYTMGFHQAPTDGAEHGFWHMHLHFYPPLLRSATVQKFMVGFEMLATPQRDLTPETAAERLAALPEIHYLGEKRL
jgi:UDPglucose--hexose-1-phosphate uridylyltransferase